METGPSARRIVDYAEDEEADLILMASRGHNLLQRLLLGSTATEVMRTTTVPVLLDRIEPAEGDENARCAGVCDENFQRPLLATDLSDSAVFMTVRDAEDCYASAGAVRTELEALAEQAACPVTVRVEQGRPASEAIADVAEEEDSMALVNEDYRSIWGRTSKILRSGSRFAWFRQSQSGHLIQRLYFQASFGPFIFPGVRLHKPSHPQIVPSVL